MSVTRIDDNQQGKRPRPIEVEMVGDTWKERYVIIISQCWTLGFGLGLGFKIFKTNQAETAG